MEGALETGKLAAEQVKSLIQIGYDTDMFEVKGTGVRL